MDRSTKRLAVMLNKLLNEADSEDKVQFEPVPKPVTKRKPLKAAQKSSVQEQETMKCPKCGTDEPDFLSLSVGEVDFFQCASCGFQYQARRDF